MNSLKSTISDNFCKKADLYIITNILISVSLNAILLILCCVLGPDDETSRKYFFLIQMNIAVIAVGLFSEKYKQVLMMMGFFMHILSFIPLGIGIYIKFKPNEANI